METNTPMKIFLVDDEPFCLHLYGQYLKSLGITEIQYFGNSGDCLNQLSLRPDLIFLDYNMDNLNGIDILKKIKRFDPNIPVVFISGQEDISVAVNALKYGAFDYLTKESLDESKLKACLDKVVLIREMMAKKNRRSMIRKIFSHFLALLFLFSLLSCKTQNLFQQGPVKKSATDSIFLDDAACYQYRIRTDDKINISIWNNDDISVGSVYGIYNSGEGYGKWLLVDVNGEIPVPAVGELKVEGLTVPEMKAMLIKELSRTIRSPVIDIKILNQDVSVLGEVKTPGKIHLEKERNTLVDIVAMAGDFDLYGNRKKIQVIRTVDGKTWSITVDLTAADSLAGNNILIHPGDIVYVPSKKRKGWDKTASNTIIPAASAITAVLLIFKTFF